MNIPVNKPHFVCIGSVTREVVTHLPDRRRTQIGGVAAQMASALASQSQPTTLMASIGDDPNGAYIRDSLNDTQINLVTLDPSPTHSGYSNIETKHGEPTSSTGHWPHYTMIPINANRIPKDADAILIDTNATTRSIADAIGAAHRMATPCLINATTTSGAIRLLQAGRTHRTAVSINRQECDSILQRAGVKQDTQLRKLLNTEHLLVTDGAQGWTIYHRDGTIISPAPQPPPHTDYVGCGDYAAAGLIISIVHQLDPAKTINDLISLRMQLNEIRSS